MRMYVCNFFARRFTDMLPFVCFWVIPRRLNFMCRRFGTLFSIFIGGWV